MSDNPFLRHLVAPDLGHGPAIVGGILLAYLFLVMGIALWDRLTQGRDE